MQGAILFSLVKPIKRCYLFPRMNKWFQSTSVIFSLLYTSAYSQAPTASSAGLDSPTNPAFISIRAFAAEPTGGIDTLVIPAGDSVFLYDGELYFRARIGDRDFFASRNEVIRHSDSLVVYQNMRITPKITVVTKTDTAETKIDRQRCTAINKNGSRCKRLAITGEDRCWQHKR
jgi:hypothetical protein